MADDFVIQGIEQANIRDNVLIHLQNLDLSRSNTDNAFWQKQIRDTVSTAVEPFGFYSSESIATVENDKIIVLVTLNAPLLIANLTREIIGEGRQDEGFRTVFNAFPLAVGDQLHQPSYEEFKSEMFTYALSHGFFDFAWQASRLDLVREENAANILLVAQSGPQYYFGDVVLKGDVRSLAIVNRIKPFNTGEKYSATALTEFNRLLNQTGYYQRVIARPVVKDAVDFMVPIEITLEHKPRDNFNVGIGFSTDTGVRVPLQWQRPWVNARGHSVLTDLFLSEREQSLTTDYRIPMQNVSDDYASVAMSYSFLDNTDRSTESETLSLSARRYWRETGENWQRILSLTYERENFTQGLDLAQTTQLLLPGASLSYIDRAETLDIANGFRFVSVIQVGSQAVVSDIDIVKATANAKFIKTINRHRFTLRGALGAIETNDFSRVPTTMRFFVGGDESIRGFALDELSTFETEIIEGNENNVPTGSRYLATASIEYAYPVAQNWRAAVFTDFGTATNDFNERITASVGIGAHWLTLAGPIRFYIAYGDSEQEGRSIRFHFAMGPEL